MTAGWLVAEVLDLNVLRLSFDRAPAPRPGRRSAGGGRGRVPYHCTVARPRTRWSVPPDASCRWNTGLSPSLRVDAELQVEAPPGWNPESTAQCSFRSGPSSARWSAALESSSVPSGCSADSRCPHGPTGIPPPRPVSPVSPSDSWSGA